MKQAARDHFIIVIWGALEIILLGGLIYGWASLVFVLKEEGYFSSSCQNSVVKDLNNSLLRLQYNTSSSESDRIISSGNGMTSLNGEFRMAYEDRKAGNNSPVNVTYDIHGQLEMAGCEEQDRHFNLVYTLATVLNGLATYPNGWLMDRFGLRLCRCLGIVTYLTAIILAAISTPALSVIIYPSMILLALGGYFFLMTNLQLGNLIPRKKATIISLYCGAYDSSAFMLVLIKLAYEGGISMRTSFICLSIIFSIAIISTFWYLPKVKIPCPLPSNYHLSLKCPPQRLSYSQPRDEKTTDIEDKEISKLCTPEGTNRNKAPEKGEGEYKTPNFITCLRSPLFLWDVVWLTCHRFASWSFVGRLNPTLHRLAGGDTAIVSQYTSVYATLQFFGVFLAPLSGRLMDRKKKKVPTATLR